MLLKPTTKQEEILLRTLVEHTACFNAVCAVGWQKRCKNGVTLHHETYRTLRVEHPDLPAQLLIAARVRATEAVKSALNRLKKGSKTSCPHGNLVPIRYDARTYTFHPNASVVSLSTVASRQSVEFARNPHADRLLAQATGFDSADLVYRKGRFWLHLVVTIPDASFSPTGNVVGVDMGLNHPAVTSTANFLGEKRWKEIDRRYFRLKRALQAKGTRSAKRHLRRLSGKVHRFRRDCDHVLSRRIVDSVEPGTVIVVENLNHIRTRVKQRGRESRRRLHSWTFAQLRSFLKYKAVEKGCVVVGIDPRHTSQMCSCCGYVHRSNRRTQSRFLCRNCGFELNADLNAARNIARKYLASSGMAATGGLLSASLSCQP
ncbi:RNA-guided endonuclease InsQ/TnpB family protein [Alicyclobacillus macrosporangiidus]|uniref:Transposase, IS605 OrfB family, central region n=1 Tax=Alicyclobacillus macrosporangiidus TaxID=392015 RepID=A0A1I7KCB6_9BACL|nr:RNA-guided endonuclease TnpB family protein [Alicyclobacillus macrosporangiidus]SFU95092.1 transposase, IS605 OrfB family, central region [Alicyclobacillus macrosporangiidus]